MENIQKRYTRGEINNARHSPSMVFHREALPRNARQAIFIVADWRASSQPGPEMSVIEIESFFH